VVDSEKLAAVFVELADTLVDDFDPLDLLHLLATRCVELLGAAGAGLLLTEDGGDLRMVVSSSDQARLLELFQLQNEEGPCLDCFHTGQPVIEPALDRAEPRWPNFAPAAVDAGFVSVVALPMRLRGQVIGALNLFGTSDHAPVREEHLPIAQSLADASTIAIIQDRLTRNRTLVNEQLQVALNSRVAIEQAKGVLSARLGIGTDEAFELLRTHSRSSRLRLTEIAEDVASGYWEAYVSDPPTR
jgi:GAF domain-containing protein